ncbi:aldo/keto reductase [Mariniflexile litorale]|uniref:Aldo/keto reductase n=1 Tax=Mariniflexile litorale TaxID=3045158 RepID=A0AAU7EH53_9FLAO|nr:aldo/keto reductase [Mariniflexile sp. KMM 9835]MDQ8211730.1 aldo/keto reductase [Mariniflexile sp. KMM 9835]
MKDNLNSYTTLNNGLKMPWLGFGVYQIEDGNEVQNAVSSALKLGYRSIDTATVYGNEIGVGKAIKESGIPREDIFLTTKVWNDDQRKNRTLAAFQESLKRLDTDYVDLYLIHWPVAGCYQKTWKVMEEIYKSGRAKAIGVSNFLVPHLQDILNLNTIVPSINQMEFHPYLVQPELLNFCQNHHIQMEAWSPLMQGHIVDVPTVQNIAKKYKKTPAQIVLRWDLQHEVITIPKSANPNRIIENTQIFDFELSQTEMEELDALDQSKRFGPDPANFDF